MLTTAQFVAHLRSLGIKLSIDDGDLLRCRAPKGSLTAELRDELAERKAELLAWLHSTGDPASNGSAEPAVHGTEPLSFAQERLWFIDRFQPGGAAYNITSAIRIRGALVVAALEDSFGELLQRHEPLRMTFVTVDGEPRQTVTPHAAFRLPILDVDLRPEHQRLAAIEALLVEEGRRPFNLAEGPVFRARLFRLAADDHLLQFTMHHIVADGWSLAIFSRELTALYRARVNGGDGGLPPLSLRYVEIARRQREWLRSPAFSEQATFWKDRLTPAPPLLELPADCPRPALQTFNGAVERFLVPEAAVERLKGMSREHGVTLFMTLFAAFNVTLHRYTGLTDIAVGVPIANRTDVETEAVIGLLVNTLVFRTDLSGDPSFGELLLRVRGESLDAYARQEFPFERLVEMLKPSRDMSHSVLFQVMFIFQNLPSRAVTLPGLTLTYPPIRTGTSKTDLTLEIVEGPEGLEMYVEYNTDLFKADTIRRFCRHLERLLEAVAGDATQPISRIPILPAAEYREIVNDWNATDTPEAAATTVPDLFEAQVARTPDAPAARFDSRPLSYRELNGRVNRLAHHLRRHGAARNARVGIFVERSLEMLIGVLAVMKTGAAYVPLDPAYPAERLEFMLEDAGISLVVTQETLRERVSIPARARVISLDRDAGAIELEGDGNPRAGIGLDDLVYVIYTSGSTGRPKGVQIAHRSLSNVLVAFRRTLEVAEHDVLVALTTLSFDIAALELLLPLVSGAQVAVASREAAADPVKLMTLFADSAATIVQATPTTWRMLLEAGWRHAKGLRILCGGEAFPPELAGPLLSTGGSVWNVYGPTETTIWSTLHRVQKGDNPIPIGRPIANTRTYVLDGNGEPVPIGVPGELYIGGAGVAKGYLDRPELTAERFVRDRAPGRSAAFLYRTGDVARYRADGALECLGRVDDQVKIRGFRIELGEIESVLASHPAIAHAVVTAREDRPGDRHLAAYFRRGDSVAPAGAELRAFLRERLPEYMIPLTFTELEVLPMTPNGKVDRRRLPEPDRRRTGSPGSLIAPRTEIEGTIAQAWREVLRLNEVGVEDNFFDLGGHSLLLVQVQTRLRDTLGQEVPIVEMFQYPTIRTMATHVARQRTAPETR
jgi:amino acid adenylation domain-containing protein